MDMDFAPPLPSLAGLVRGAREAQALVALDGHAIRYEVALDHLGVGVFLAEMAGQLIGELASDGLFTGGGAVDSKDLHFGTP